VAPGAPDAGERHGEIERDMLVAEVEQLDREIKRLDQELNTIGAQHSGVILLRTIPGVGLRTAEAVMAYIDDPHRFRRTKAIGSYFGFVPCQDESAGKARFGHITREGPRIVRRMLTEAAWQAIRHSPELAAYYAQVCRDDPKRRKIALVALGHRMARIMLSMLKTGETWRGQTLRKAA
jgi:transposase